MGSPHLWWHQRLPPAPSGWWSSCEWEKGCFLGVMRRSEAKEEKDTPSGPESLPLWEGLFTVFTPGTVTFYYM